VGELLLEDLLKARVANLDAENRRERHLVVWDLFRARASRAAPRWAGSARRSPAAPTGPDGPNSPG
jgi:hypothetical protein